MQENMKSQLTQLNLSSGGMVWIEAQEVQGEVRAGMGESVTKSFEEAFQALQVKSSEVKFGTVVGTEANAWIAKASGQALICKVGL